MSAHYGWLSAATSLLALLLCDCVLTLPPYNPSEPNSAPEPNSIPDPNDSEREDPNYNPSPPSAVDARAMVGTDELSHGQTDGSTLVRNGDEPDFFGTSLTWSRQTDETVLCLIINAADEDGVCIPGLRAGDTIEITSARGRAVFDDQNGNTFAQCIVGLMAAGADLLMPDVVDPLITEAEEWAQREFGKVREELDYTDASGYRKHRGHYNRQAGGVIVCLPQAGGPLHSAENTRQQFWLRDPNLPRTDGNLPDHVVGKALFYQQGMSDNNKAVLCKDGEVYILAWDWKYFENSGSYTVYVHITKGFSLESVEPCP